MNVMGVTGMPGSGKSIVSRMAADMGFVVVRMGDVIREEAQKRNQDPGEVAVDLRKEYGEFVVAERTVELIKRIASNHEDPSQVFCIIEGIRSPSEVEIFIKKFPKFKVIAVYSSPKTRYKRLKRRRRDDDSPSLEEFKKRDLRELKFGIGDVISTSDYLMVNEGSLKKFKKLLRSILKNEMQSKG